MVQKKNEGRKIITKIVDTSFVRSNGQCTHSSRTKWDNDLNSFTFLFTPMGVFAPGSVHARLTAEPPIDVSGNYLSPVSAE